MPPCLVVAANPSDPSLNGYTVLQQRYLWGTGHQSIFTAPNNQHHLVLHLTQRTSAPCQVLHATTTQQAARIRHSN